MFKGIQKNSGINISRDEAFAYALKGIRENKELENEFVEWFFSGNFVEFKPKFILDDEVKVVGHEGTFKVMQSDFCEFDEKYRYKIQSNDLWLVAVEENLKAVIV